MRQKHLLPLYTALFVRGGKYLEKIAIFENIYIRTYAISAFRGGAKESVGVGESLS
jgi:hypothetical protein